MKSDIGSAQSRDHTFNSLALFLRLGDASSAYKPYVHASNRVRFRLPELPSLTPSATADSPRSCRQVCLRNFGASAYFSPAKSPKAQKQLTAATINR